ncbi:MAG: putative alcohol dehydrogenase [Rhodoglobus sp.]|nr:putative alcohol dehydrogenase [Rhodoglobus sp.]
MSIQRYEMARTATIVSGAGARHSLADDIDAGLGERVALITSPSVAKTAQFRDIAASLGSRVVLQYEEVQPHPPADSVVDLIARARNAKADTFVGVGGGSSIDSAKFASLSLSEDIHTVAELTDFGVHFEYPDREWTRPLSGPAGQILSVPTTLSAAEWDGFAGTVDTATGVKHVARYLELTPTVVYLDPEITSTTPRALWATTGMRAVDHAIETSYARNAIPFTTTLAMGALELLAGNLRKSVADPTDFEAALACQWAGMMSITGVHNVSLGLSHAIGHQLGGFGVPHGVTSCITLPHVMRFLLPATVAQQARIAEAFGVSGADAAAGAVESLLNDLGVPTRIRDVGVPKEAFESIARATLGDIVSRESPVPVTQDAIIGLLEEAW